MPNGQLKTTKDYVIDMSRQLTDFIEKVKEQKEDHEKQHIQDDKKHAREHIIMWGLIIGIPASIGTYFGLAKLIGG